MTERPVAHLLKNSSFYSFAGMLPQFIGFLLLPIYTRFLSPEEFGTLALISVISILLGLFMKLHLHGAITRFYIEYHGEERRRFIGTVFIAIIGLSILVTTAALLCGAILVDTTDFSVPFFPYLFIGIINAFLSVFAIVPITVLRIREQPTRIVAITVCSSVMNAVLAIYFLTVVGRGVSGVLLATFWTSLVIALVYFIPFTIRNCSLSFSRRYLKEATAYSLPLLPHGLAGYVFMYTDRFILERFVPLGPIGIYNVGDRLGGVMKTGVNSFNEASVPYFMKLSKHDPKAREIYAKVITSWAILATFGALALSLFSREIMRLLTTPEFHEAYRLVPILVLAYFFRGLYCFPVNGLFYAKKTRVIPVITISAATVNIILGLLTIPEYGIYGAAWSTVCAFGVSALLAFHFGNKYHPLQYETRKLVQIFGSGLILFLSAWYATEYYLPDVLHLPDSSAIPVKAVALLLFVGFLWLSKIVSPDTVFSIRSQLFPSAR